MIINFELCMAWQQAHVSLEPIWLFLLNKLT